MGKLFARSIAAVARAPSAIIMTSHRMGLFALAAVTAPALSDLWRKAACIRREWLGVGRAGGPPGRGSGDHRD